MLLLELFQGEIRETVKAEGVGGLLLVSVTVMAVDVEEVLLEYLETAVFLGRRSILGGGGIFLGVLDDPILEQLQETIFGGEIFGLVLDVAGRGEEEEEGGGEEEEEEEGEGEEGRS